MQKLIYILEDNDDLRELYGFILEGENYSLKMFATVTSFMENSRSVPDLYLLDVMLPDGDGMVLCEELKANPKTSHVPIILISAHKGTEEANQRCPDASFIPKPFNIDELTRKVAQLIT
ncbi:response regulator transcription factor [Pedobacter boryungensis]|uniref:Response regulator n=1 Tax=Pedobacter boryungensis TaxID=869962 RepID=A0ABX2DGE4_9SPHI|nr:response regulator [Pedobacter boryungensis]NQX33140.1 response regulator [Pedobacter boryungensis]